MADLSVNQSVEVVAALLLAGATLFRSFALVLLAAIVVIKGEAVIYLHRVDHSPHVGIAEMTPHVLCGETDDPVAWPQIRTHVIGRAEGQRANTMKWVWREPTVPAHHV